MCEIYYLYLIVIKLIVCEKLVVHIELFATIVFLIMSWKSSHQIHFQILMYNIEDFPTLFATIDN